MGSSTVLPQDGWTRLFDGKSLSGWTLEANAKWKVAEGVIVGDAGGDGWLRSNKAYTDFILKCDYRCGAKVNSGIFFRATQKSTSEGADPLEAYELQIFNENAEGWPTGSIENVIKRLMDVNPAANTWHHYELEVRGTHISATLDGTKVVDGKDSKLRSGYIGLQHHKDNKAEFRDIYIKTLAR